MSADPDPVRIGVRVRPGASRNRVGGRWGSPADQGDVLVVAVTARAVDGAATAAVCRAVAAAVGVRPDAVRVVVGHTSRSKVLEINKPPHDIVRRLAELLDG